MIPCSKVNALHVFSANGKAATTDNNLAQPMRADNTNHNKANVYRFCKLHGKNVYTKVVATTD